METDPANTKWAEGSKFTCGASDRVRVRGEALRKQVGVPWHPGPTPQRWVCALPTTQLRHGTGVGGVQGKVAAQPTGAAGGCNRPAEQADTSRDSRRTIGQRTQRPQTHILVKRTRTPTRAARALSCAHTVERRSGGALGECPRTTRLRCKPIIQR